MTVIQSTKHPSHQEDGCVCAVVSRIVMRIDWRGRTQTWQPLNYKWWQQQAQICCDQPTVSISMTCTPIRELNQVINTVWKFGFNVLLMLYISCTVPFRIKCIWSAENGEIKRLIGANQPPSGIHFQWNSRKTGVKFTMYGAFGNVAVSSSIQM